MDASTEVAIRMIRSALDRLSNDSSARTVFDFAWFDSNVPNLIVESDKCDELQNHLHVTKAAEKLLRQMLSCASEAVTQLNDQFTEAVNRRRFSSLPNEMLANIFEMVCEQDFRVANTLSLVCRRFRDIVLNLPILWSDISPHLSIERAELFASRITTPTISFRLFASCSPIDTEYLKLMRTYALMVSVSSRIQTLSLRISKYDLQRFEDISQICSSLSLPFLESLSLYSSAMDVAVGRRFKGLCGGWDMPRLKKLEVEEFLPEIDPDIASRIESCKIVANRERKADEIDICWRTSEIVVFILSLSSVKDLEVAVRVIDHYQPEEDLVMDSVKSFTLGLQSLEVAMTLCILDIIHFPTITSFKLELGLHRLDVLDQVLVRIRSSFRAPAPMSVTNLTLAVGHEHGTSYERYPVRAVHLWCEGFGDLESVTLESKREKSHGLFAFAGSFDVLHLTLGDGTPLPKRALRKLPDYYFNRMGGMGGCHRVAHLTPATIHEVAQLDNSLYFDMDDWW